jgi:hypothetical protein
MTPHCFCCGSIQHKYTTQLHPNITCNHYHHSNHYAYVCLTQLLESCSFKTVPQWVTAIAFLVFSSSLAALLHTPATITALIANVDKLEQENAQLKDSVALFQKQIAELQVSIAANF